MTRRLSYLFVSINIVALVISIAGKPHALPLLVGVGLIGLLWMAAITKRWAWANHLSFLGLVGVATLAMWLEMPTVGLVVGAGCSLVAWDLTDFQRRLDHAAQDDDIRPIEHRHVGLIFLVTVAGLVLSGLALVTQLEISFGWIFLAGLLGGLGLWGLATWVDR